MYKKVIWILVITFIIIVSFIIFKFIIYNKTNSNNLTEKSQFSIGVNIHFVKPNIEEVSKLHKAGFKIVRMDLSWASIERVKGIYNFTDYDTLVRNMNESNIKILFILNYSNPLYDNGISPHTDEGRKAFANFAKNAAEHYKDKGIVWEIWNEPNIGFWKPKPNAADYSRLAIDTINAIRSKDKNAFIIAPALAGVDYNFLNQLGRNQIFKYIDAVSIHPYRQKNPETVIEDYKKLRQLIQKYPHNENIEIFSGEWGYSTSWKNMNDMKQAQYCIREYLTNIMCGVNVSIWYDWKDDGTNKSNQEHNFGTVYNDLTPKPTYYAIQTMNTALNGYRYVKRIDTQSKDDYVLMFQKGDKVVYAVWTTGKSHDINIDLKNNKVQVIELMGKNYNDKGAKKKYKINLDENVKYILN
ncbi:hypothetical protein CPAST_c06630 [Clostridium pasteurianum DSM 525 = ATCC 6013]|uniref:Uncharacterized protein n=1 Tax=Clostridium pasteurianum DSM 525 = ATCC 6013 TaxID=1262449 RepID=A0A0H3J4C5_CLOPA|nr:hypothetical protein [Clostridium pasteurianum]AJA46763.1 hypothetical protein CPAST_c06630 [Clostridium pasteurianum DSM 525 = ATCC 6013]AJA50751.1 hypothetical protein CLPA_c06630 [Clostridium pasteurianum DSM 525 = ATCC 6013]AOZ74157.1 beta-1,4-xylanase [Clostridium pasteurianum DSM 525 = ATCC 6013]AOZ77954.1 beta-1,4-xylanase [Clostridium pasteurianum]ELP58627.1 family 5 glycosyl hydrolase [Clostridium pasteurianum DSM 525 = ATCC 6013]